MADNFALASLMARPEATQNYASMADAMRARAMMPYQQQQMQAQTAATQAQVPIQQQQAQSLALENQQRQIQLQDQQRMMEYWSNPEKYKEQSAEPVVQPSGSPQGASVGASMAGTPIPAGTAATGAPKANFAQQMLGLNADDPLAVQANGMMRAGVMPQSVIANTQALLGFRTAVLKQTTDKQAAVKEGLAQINQLLAPIGAEQDQTKRAAMLQAAEPELQKASEFDPSIHQAIMQIDPQHVDKILNLTGGMQDVLEYGTKQAQQLAEKQKTAVPGKDDRNLATQTISTLSAIPPDTRQALQSEIGQAPTIEAMQKVQARADAMQESFQRTAEAHQNALAMKDVAVQQAMATHLIGEDKTLQTALNQTLGIRGLLDMSKGGNQVATAAAQTRFAEHEIVEGGVKRMNQTEFDQLATNLGDYGRQFKAWADKGFQGKMPETTNNEMQQILDAEDKVATQQHDTAIDSIQNRFSAVQGVPKTPAQAPAKTPAKEVKPNANQPPPGATHFGIGSVDKKKHWLDANGKDLGVSD